MRVLGPRGRRVLKSLPSLSPREAERTLEPAHSDRPSPHVWRGGILSGGSTHPSGANGIPCYLAHSGDCPSKHHTLPCSSPQIGPHLRDNGRLPLRRTRNAPSPRRGLPRPTGAITLLRIAPLGQQPRVRTKRTRQEGPGGLSQSFRLPSDTPSGSEPITATHSPLPRSAVRAAEVLRC